MPQRDTLNPSVHRSTTEKASERSILRVVPALKSREYSQLQGLIATAEKPQRWANATQGNPE